MSAPAGTAVGISVPQLEGDEKLCGSAQYIADLHRPGMLHGAILQSPHAHARIRGYDLSAARALPGVRAIVTGDDLDERHRMGAFIKDEPAFAKGKVRYVGEIVAAVAADTEAIAREATRLIARRLRGAARRGRPGGGARRPAPPLIHEDSASYIKVFDAGTDGNLCSRTEFTSGDVDAAWARVRRRRRVDLPDAGAGAPLARAVRRARGDRRRRPRSRLWSANQSVFRVQANVCESLGLPMTRLRCLTPRVGAGFGNKMEAHVQPVVVLLAMKARRTVRLVLSREEDFETVRARHPFTIRIKTGARRDGTLVAREIELLLDGGAYGDDSPGVLGYALLDAVRPLPHPARARARPGRLHQQAALRRLPRLRRAAGHLRLRIAARRARRQLGLDPIALAPAQHARRPATRGSAARRSAPTAWPSASTSSSANRAGTRRCRAPRPTRPPASACAAAAASPVGAHQRPARLRRHRPPARGRQRAAQHRRGRHRPGLEHGADADLRRGAAGSGRAGGDRQPRHRRLALQLGHDRQPRHLRRRPLGGRRRRRGRAAAQEPRRRDARMQRRRPRAAARRQGRDQGRARRRR